MYGESNCRIPISAMFLTKTAVRQLPFRWSWKRIEPLIGPGRGSVATTALFLPLVARSR